MTDVTLSSPLHFVLRRNSWGRRRLASLSLGLSALALSSCGGPENSAELCQFDVLQNEVIIQSTQKVVTLTGELPLACKTLTRENTGKLTVQLRLVGPRNPEISLSEMQAGARSKEFDATVSNLKVGSVDASFSSQAEPAWSVPWSDSPKLLSVALLAPLEIANGELPQRASVRLSL